LAKKEVYKKSLKPSIDLVMNILNKKKLENYGRLDEKRKKNKNKRRRERKGIRK
jgi:hypothetical protein